MNYYDDKTLEKNIEEFVITSINQQLGFGIERNAVFCLGEGKNYKYLSKLNAAHGFFDQVIPLSHPRFIMQYKLKKKDEYIEKYLSTFNNSTIQYQTNLELKTKNLKLKTWL